MITITFVLLIAALICALLALLGVSARIDLTALGLFLAVIALLIGHVN